MRGLRMAKLTGYNVPADTTVTFFSILRERDSCNRRLATYEIARAFREILNKEPKGESRDRRERTAAGRPKVLRRHQR